MLVKAHGPERHDADLRVGIQLGQRFQVLGGHAGQFRGVFQVVLGNEFGEIVVGDRARAPRVVGVFRRFLQGVFGTQAIADVGIAFEEFRVLVDELAVDALGLDDVVGDVVQDRQIALRRESQRQVCEFIRAVLKGG
ncbi:hypothetical protein D3C72_1966220 [compost metagenome]